MILFVFFLLLFSRYFQAQIHRVSPVRSISSSRPDFEREELEQLRINLSTLTAQNAQLEEANHAWQQYHQNQLEQFRHLLENWISFDENFTLEQIAPQIINQFEKNFDEENRLSKFS